jgi:excisionase family DNA binding protein
MSAAPPKTVSLPDSEQRQVQAVERMLHRGVPILINPSGERIELPEKVFEVLRTAVKFMSHGQAVTLVPENKVVTTQHAADILGMSRPFFVKLLDSGAMPHHRVGNQRRVYLRDVLAYGRKRDRERLASLDRLARDAYDAGLYQRNAMPEGGSDE